MTQTKTISIAMCTYNGEKYLREQLDSIAAQTRLPDELVICDDCSTDSTTDIIRNFSDTVPFPVRLHVNHVNIGGEAKGITRNFEQASRLCVGDLIAFCDQDDVWFAQKLSRMAEEMEKNHQLGGVFVDAQLMDDKGNPKGILLSQTTGMNRSEHKKLMQGQVLSVLLSMNKVYGCTLMVDAKLLIKLLPVPPNWWFDAWVPCSVAVHSKLEFIPEPLFYYRIHANQSGVGASFPTVPERMGQWKHSAADYWTIAEPQLADLYDRLLQENSVNMKPYQEYIHGRMKLLRYRAKLPANHISRAIQIITKTSDYCHYFNGWKSILKDLTA